MKTPANTQKVARKDGNHKIRHWINVYRTGGTANFKWNECIPVDSESAAIEQRKDLERAGYRAYTYRYEQYMAIGAPETYE